MFFGLVGSAILFLALMLLYVIRVSSIPETAEVRLPNAFFVSTIVMLFSSYGLSKTQRAFHNDNMRELSYALTATLVFALIFCTLQAIGWYQLYKAGFFINSKSGIGFLYMITGLHMVHVIAGVIFLVSCLLPVYNGSGDMVKALIFFSDRYQQTKIELLNIYWHYVDFLWLCLFLMFLFTV